MRRVWWALALLATAGLAPAQDDLGLTVFTQNCASCHGAQAPPSSAPKLEALRLQAPESVLAALTSGVMRAQALRLTPAERRAAAEYVTGKGFSVEAVDLSLGRCATSTPMSDPAKGPQWSGWGNDLVNSRRQTAEQAGLTAAEVPKLKLKWAIGLPETSHAWSQPTVAGGRVFVGSQGGYIYSLDAKTGCVHWVFTANGAMRTSINIGPRDGQPGAYLAYFSTIPGWVYALDANTGEQVWKVRAEDHVSTRTTGSPVLYDGKLYVPVASFEEGMATSQSYECCSFRGSLSAFDAQTGELLWKQHTIEEPLEVIRTSPSGKVVRGPSGGGIWSAPVIDPKRGAIYVATGNNFTGPLVETTDAIVALDLDTGEMRWARQVTEDIFLPGCDGPRDRVSVNCADDNGPDFDFGSAPILAKLPNGKDIIVAGQKSGWAWAFDPDNDGAVLWKYQAISSDSKPGIFGGVTWGQAADAEHMYVPVSDIQAPERAGGLHAIKLTTGERAWFAPPVAPICEPGRGCNAAQAAPPTVIDGVVFAGSADGGLRAYSSKDGTVIWTFDTNPIFETVNQVEAQGGSMIGAGPVVAGGMVYVTSGYGSHEGRAGNVLLALGVD